MKATLSLGSLAVAAILSTVGVACSSGDRTGSAESGSVADTTAVDTAAVVAADTLPSEVTILFAGDAMMHRNQLAAALQADGSYDCSGYFDSIAYLISGADYAVVNLETTLSDSDMTGYPMFCSPYVYADELKKAGFDMFLTANNHCLDRRDAGGRRTIDYLDAIGVDHIGTYRNAAERDSLTPCIVDIGGFKVGFLNYTYATNGIPIQGDFAVNYIRRDAISRDIEATRRAGAELLCVCMHWGTEYVLLPNSYEREYASFLYDQGVDLIIGGHPHVVQPIELKHNDKSGRPSLTVYSLGNFMSGMRTTDTRGGLVVTATLARDDKGQARVDRAAYKLVFVERPSAGHPNFYLVEADKTSSAGSAPFRENAYRVLNTHNVNVAPLR